MSSIESTTTCASEGNDLSLGASHDGASIVSLGPVMPSAKVRISFDRECDTFTADELKGRVAFATATSVQVMGLDEQTACGTWRKPSGVKPVRSSTLEKSATSDRSAAKQPTGKQGKKKGYCPPPRPASRMQLGLLLLPTQTIGEVLRHTALIADPIRRHAVILCGEVSEDAEDWEREFICSTRISVEDFTCAMCGFAGARVNPVDVPDEIIGAFRPVENENDIVGLTKLQRLVVFGKYLYERDVRSRDHYKPGVRVDNEVMASLMYIYNGIPSECFLRFTEDKVLDVNASFGVFCTLLEPSSELLVEVPEEVVRVYGPKPTRRLVAIAKKQELEKMQRVQEPVLPVTIQYRDMPVVERVTHHHVKPSGSARNGTKSTEVRATCSFKVDEKILNEEAGRKAVANSKAMKRVGGDVGSTIVNRVKKTTGDSTSQYTPAQLSGFVSEGLSTLSYILKNAEKSEKIIHARTGKVLKTMLDDEAFAAFLSGCTAANSPRNDIYKVLCVIARKEWTKDFKTSCAMFFRDMVLDATAFEVYITGVSDISEQTSQRAAMDSLRVLLTDFKFVSSTVVVSKAAASATVEAPPAEDGDVLDEGFM
jgi:hypothetical protein